MVLTAFAEVLSIASIVPFIGVLTAPERLFFSEFAQPVIIFLEISESKQLLLPLTICFGAAAFFAGILRLLLIWTSTRVSFSAGADLSLDIYQKTLHQPYSMHCRQNSSELINGITVKANGVIYGVLMPFLTITSSCLMLIAICSVLFLIDWYVATISFSTIGLFYFLMIKFTRSRLISNSDKVAKESTNTIKALQEGIGGIRDVLIHGSQSTYIEIYRKANWSLRSSQGNTVFISASPKFIIEAIGMIMIATLAYILSQRPDGIVEALPILGALAMGAQRLLPAVQQAYEGWSNIRGTQASLEDVLHLLDQKILTFGGEVEGSQVSIQNSIEIRNLWFRYDENEPYVLKNINLLVRKGNCVGFVGQTGSGKSTLGDIIMGLLCPTKGSIEIDGCEITDLNRQSWQSHIAHVPQNIFLADSSIEENIAFGVPKQKIDKQLVELAAQKAQIHDTIEQWPRKYQTFVGERGIRLSGGQRQRIGIARALYRKAEVIVFDEATSALDEKTETAVMETIKSLKNHLTVFIITHRKSTLNICDNIVNISNCEIKTLNK